MSDNDCQSSCGNPPAGESYCCDTAAGVCVAYGGNACPATKNNGGTGDNVGNPNGGSGSSNGGGSGSSNGGSGSSNGGSGSSSSGGGGGMCPAMCMADSDCQNSCPAASNGGTNCCDTTMGMCFVSTSSTCPVNDGGAPVSD